MKIVARLMLQSDYDDGAGAVGVYSYYITPATLGREYTIPDATIWKVHRFVSAFPNITTTVTAYALTVTTGSPPAYGGRTLTLSSAGKVVFTGTNPEYETIKKVRVTLTQTLVPDHTYTIWDVIGEYSAVGRFAQISSIMNNVGTWYTVTSPVENVILEDVTGWGAEGNYLMVEFTPTTADITAGQLRQMAVAWAEGDLLSRPYNGAMLEMGLKTLYAMVQAKGGKSKSLLSSVVTEVAGYAAGDGPFDVYIPRVEKTIAMGV